MVAAALDAHFFKFLVFVVVVVDLGHTVVRIRVVPEMCSSAANHRGHVRRGANAPWGRVLRASRARRWDEALAPRQRHDRAYGRARPLAHGVAVRQRRLVFVLGRVRVIVERVARVHARAGGGDGGVGRARGGSWREDRGRCGAVGDEDAQGRQGDVAFGTVRVERVGGGDVHGRRRRQ